MDQNNNAALYVGDLAPEVTEAALFNTFCVVGPVASIRVCRHHHTRRSLGYAYVNFHQIEDAERALDTLNYTKICGRACRIMWSQRDPYAKQLRKNGEGNVFVSNLDPSIDNRTLLDTFSMFGDILSCKVETDKEGKSRGFGFVHYADKESADKAINKVNGMEISGKKLYCTKWQSRNARDGQLETTFTNVYVKNFPVAWSEDDLKKLFEDYGQINGCAISRDEKGKSRQFGFVTFNLTDEAQKAVEELNDYEVDIDGTKEKLFVGRAQSKRERQKLLNKLYYAKKRKEKAEEQKNNDASLFIKNLDDTIDSDALSLLFKEFGTIESAKVMTKADGTSKGFGFVTYEKPEEAKTALEKMNDKEVEGKKIFVDVATPPTWQNRKKTTKWNSYPTGSSPRRGRYNTSVGGHYAHTGYGGMQYAWQFAGSANPRQPMSNYGYMTAMPQRGYMQSKSPRKISSSRPLQKRGSSNRRKKQTSEQKQQIGEKLFPRVQKIDMAQAGKITGMLLEMDTTDLQALEHSDQRLRDKVREAQDVLRRAGKKK